MSSVSRQKTADSGWADVAVVGAGIAGCSLAYELAGRGLKVALLERGARATGASSLPVALLNPHRGRSGRASELDRAGLARMTTLHAELRAAGIASGIHLPGVLRIASNRKQAKTWRRLSGVRLLEPGEIGPPYHAPFGGFLVPKGGFVETATLLSGLLDGARRRGAELSLNCEVEEVVAEESGLHLHSSCGVLKTRHIVYCTGVEAPPKAASTIDFPAFTPIAGEVVELALSETLPHPLAGPLYGAQLGRRFYLGGNHRPAERRDPDAPAQLQGSASWFIPALKGAERLSVWTGVRAKKGDNQPIAKRLGPRQWFLGVLGGRGFLCAAHLAQGLAADLLRELESSPRGQIGQMP